MRISCAYKKKNCDALTAADVTESFIKTIRKRQVKFMVHINRRGGIKKLALCEKILRNRDGGRQRDFFGGWGGCEDGRSLWEKMGNKY